MVHSPYYKARDGIVKALKNAVKSCGYPTTELAASVDLSRAFGDISSSISFRIAKELKLNPNEVAQKIIAAFKKPDYVESVAPASGYMNFSLKRPKFSSDVIKYALRLAAGTPISDLGGDEKIIIEYPSVNPNKPWHLGHLKNAVLGDSVARIHSAYGYNVEREDFIEDLGSQVVESLWGYLNMDNDPKGKKFDQWLGEEYVRVNKFMESNDIKGQLSRLLQNMEQHGTKEAQLARQIAEKCVMAQNETASSYGIYRDILVWETDIMSKIYDNALEMLLKSGVAEKVDRGENKDCIIMDLSKVKKLPPEFRGLKEKIKVLVRNDGTPTYVAKDIAFHMWKFGIIENSFGYIKFIEQPSGRILYTTTPSPNAVKMDFAGVKKAINIIDSRQEYPQGLLRLAFSCMDRNDVAENIVHLSYGPLELESGAAMSGRKGTWIGNSADDLLSATKAKAAEILSESRFKLTDVEKKEVSRKVSIAAIKFDLLKQSPEKKTLFSWTKALNFDGNSGPYCQYMYARAFRLIESAGIREEQIAKADLSVITDDNEFALVKLISQLGDIVEKACTELRPNVVAEYANELAYGFSKFYENVPVLKAESDAEKAARLALCAAFIKSLAYALDLLGIEVAQRM